MSGATSSPPCSGVGLLETINVSSSLYSIAVLLLNVSHQGYSAHRISQYYLQTNLGSTTMTEVEPSVRLVFIQDWLGKSQGVTCKDLFDS